MASYEKSKSSGLWSVRFRVTLADGSVKQPRLSGFKTKKEAIYAYEDYIASRPFENDRSAPKPEELTPPSPGEMLFEEFLSEFLRHQKPRIKESSFKDMTQKFCARISPSFNGMKVKDITPRVLLEWTKSLEGYAYKYQKDLFNYLSSLYNFGEKYFDIPNVMKKIDRPRNTAPKKEMQVWSPEEFNKAINTITSEPYHYYFKMLYLAACRRGEGLALTWDDINLTDGTVRINKSVSFKVGKNGKSYQVTSPKTADSNRTVTLPRFFIEELKKYKKWQSENYSDTTFVFCGADPLRPTNITRAMNNAAVAAGVKRIRVHDLRHSCASYLISCMNKGVTIVSVSKHLGHSTVKQTMETYAHLLPKDFGSVTNALEDLKFN